MSRFWFFPHDALRTVSNTTWNWSNSKKVLQIQMQKVLLLFLFEILESHLQSLPVKYPSAVHGYLGWVCGRGEVYRLESNSTISKAVQQHQFYKSNNYNNYMQLSKLLFVLTHCPWFYYEGSCYQSVQISWCVGFRGQGSMYQALVSYFELFDNFVTIRILLL